MAIPLTLAWLACAAAQNSDPGPSAPPSPHGAGAVEFRVYFFRPGPAAETPPEVKEPEAGDLALMLAVTSGAAKAKTILLDRVDLKEGEAPPEGADSQVRKLEGTPYFARLVVVGAGHAEKKDQKDSSATPPASEGEEHARAKAPEVKDPLRKVYFRVEMRPEDVPKYFKASLTLRAGTRSFAARAFSYPFAAQEGAAFGRIENGLKEVATAMDTAAFGRIPTLTLKIADDLEELAGVTSKDPKGEKEYDRQWCLTLCRRIERASYTGDDDINTLVRQFRVRLARLKDPNAGTPSPAPLPKEPVSPSSPEPAPQPPKDAPKEKE